MNTKMIAVSCVGLSGFVGGTLAQPAGTYASGLRHTPVGGVSEDMSVTERRLTACCLGSSGEDGVEVSIRSQWGGGVGVDLSPLGSPGSELRIRPRGWDGTIKGNLRVTTNPDGTITSTVDFSAIGAVACLVETFDPLGQVITTVTLPGPIWAGPTVPDCTPPLVPTVWYTQNGQWVWGCGYGNNLNGDPYPDQRVSPILPPGVPDDWGIESVLVTGTNVGPINVLDASMGTFGVSSWGVGGAVISEQCMGPSEPCPPEQIALVAANIGSSGNDGVVIDLGHSAGSVSVARRRCSDCPPGHTTLMKVYDEQARVMLSVPTTEDDLTGVTNFSPDFSGIGANEYLLELLDDDGNPIATSLQISGYAIAYLTYCPQGSYPKWVWIAGHWYFFGCIHYTDFVLPTGEVIPNVAEARLTPINATSSGTPRQCVITDTGTITVSNVTVTPRCQGDLNGDGTVDLADLAGLLSHFGMSSGATFADGDFNGDGSVDLTDLSILLSQFGTNCP